MSTEEVKYKQQISPILDSRKATASSSTQNKKNDADKITEAFKRFAQKNGISLTTESFLGVINSHPEILALPANKQASELLKLFSEDKTTSQTETTEATPSPAPEQKSQTTTTTSSQASTSTTTPAQANPFGTQIAENELFTEVLANIQLAQDSQTVTNFFATAFQKTGNETAEATMGAAETKTGTTSTTNLFQSGNTEAQLAMLKEAAKTENDFRAIIAEATVSASQTIMAQELDKMDSEQVAKIFANLADNTEAMAGAITTIGEVDSTQTAATSGKNKIKSKTKSSFQSTLTNMKTNLVKTGKKFGEGIQSVKAAAHRKNAQKNTAAAYDKNKADTETQENIKNQKNNKKQAKVEAEIKSFAEAYNSSEFCSKTEEEQKQAYREALALNLFMNGNPPKTKKEWNKLSAEQKNEFYQKAEQQMAVNVSKSASAMTEIFSILNYTPSESNNASALEFQMTLLQAANYEGISVEEFQKKPKMEQFALIANYLDTKQAEELGGIDKIIVNKAGFIRDAFAWNLRDMDRLGENEKLTYKELFNIMYNSENKEDLGVGSLILNYLEELERQGKLTPELEELKKTLNEIGADLIRDFGSLLHVDLTLEKELENDEKYKNATPEEKQDMLVDHFFATAVDTDKGTVDGNKLKTLVDECTPCLDNLPILKKVMDRLAETFKLNRPTNAAEIEEIFLQDSSKRTLYAKLSPNLFTPEGQIKLTQDAAGDYNRAVQEHGAESEEAQIEAEYVNATFQIQFSSIGAAVNKAMPVTGSSATAMADSNIVSGSAEAVSEIAVTVITSEVSDRTSAQAATETMFNFAGNGLVSEESFNNFSNSFRTTPNLEALTGGTQVAGTTDSPLSKTLIKDAFQNKQLGVELATNLREADENGEGGFTSFPEENQNTAVYEANGAYERARAKNPNDPKLKEDHKKFVDASPTWYASSQAIIVEEAAKSPHSEIVEAVANNIPKYDKSVQAKAVKAVIESGNEKATNTAIANISKMDQSVQAEAIKQVFATNNTNAIEMVLSQVKELDSSVLASIQQEIDEQIALMEKRHGRSLVEEFAKRQVNKEFGMNVDNRSQQFQSRREKYMAELKDLPQSEINQRLCQDIQYWSIDMQSAAVEMIVKYCPSLFNMMLSRYGIKLLTSFGQINSSTKNEILREMLKSSGSRAEAMEYLKSNPDSAYSDSVKDLYNRFLAEKTGDDYDKAKAQKHTPEVAHQTVPDTIGSQSGSTRTNLFAEDSYWKTKANLNYYLA